MRVPGKVWAVLLVAAGAVGVLLAYRAAINSSQATTAPGTSADASPYLMEPDAIPSYLSELPWRSARTGWVALADDNLPKLDASFTNGTLTIADRAYEKGLGTFPLSEIEYGLDGKYDSFQAEVGIDGSVPPGRGSAVFRVFLDGMQAYSSGILRAGDLPRRVALAVRGVEALRLVVEDAGDGSDFDFANWANARLMPRASDAPDETEGLADVVKDLARAASGLVTGASGLSEGDLRRAIEASRDERRRMRAASWSDLARRTEQEMTDFLRVSQKAGPSMREATAVFDPERQRIVLYNEKVVVTLGYGGGKHGLLDILDLETRTLVAYDTTPSITTRDFSAVALSRHTRPTDSRGYSWRRVNDPALGKGTELTADFLVSGPDVVISTRLTLFDEESYLTYQLQLREAGEHLAVGKFSFFDSEKGGSFLIGERAGYVTDHSLPRQAIVRDDSLVHRELVGLGKPVVLRDSTRHRGLVLAIIDEVADPAIFTVQLAEGNIAGRLSFEHQVPEDVRASLLQISPRLFFQVVPFTNPRSAAEGFLRVMAALYPPLPMPEWIKYQWGTWYAFGMDYDEDTIKAQVDYIAQNLADLGPWSILLDAGWYVAGGEPDSTWVVDGDKFPGGLRALVDYVHSKGMKVVLYFSAPYLDDRQREGNWLGLRGFLHDHPDWAIRLQSDNTGASYVYDFTNPELVAYMRTLIRDFFTVYDVDGIKIDGLGQAEGEQLSVEERDRFGDVNKIRMFTMDIYRLVYEEALKAKKDAYLESGWAVPNYANRFAHTFRYGDEFPEFSHRYPAGGLLEHVDYAISQKTVIGQRPNMGMVWGGAESQRTIRSWFEAALALGTQMTLSSDLTHLPPRDLSALRAVLVHYNAFQGDTVFLGTPWPDSFATATGGITYLGAINREPEQKQIALQLSDYGLDLHKPYLVYDVSAGRYFRARGSVRATLDGSSFRLFLLRDSPGVVWTNSSFEADSTAGSLTVRVKGPRTIGGFAQILVPRPSSVTLDGNELTRSANLSIDRNYSYDESTGVLRVRYRHTQPRTIEVTY